MQVAIGIDEITIKSSDIIDYNRRIDKYSSNGYRIIEAYDIIEDSTSQNIKLRCIMQKEFFKEGEYVGFLILKILNKINQDFQSDSLRH